MLLRSSSSPILNSWLPNSAGSSPEPENLSQLTRTLSVTMTMASYNSEARPVRESDLKDPDTMKKKVWIKPPGTPKPLLNKQGKMERLLSISGLGAEDEEEGCLAVAEKKKKESVLQTLVAGGGGVGCNGGYKSGFGSNRWYGPDGTDAYYRKMIEANPGNALLLSNYAKFLKEVKGDLAKAEEYCGRAILANPTDGTALSLYADLIWKSQKDASRAQTYFDQAVKNDPDDCYVLASYARFLWDAEEDEEEEEKESSQYGTGKNSASKSIFGGVSDSPPSLTAAS